MITKIYSALEVRFGIKVATSIMSVLTVLMLIWIITSFKVNFALGVIMLFVAVTPLVIGLVTVITLGHVNLAAIINDLLFHTSTGMTIVIGLLLVALGLLMYRLPNIINEWAQGKIFIK
jgi:hypothetical protein